MPHFKAGNRFFFDSSTNLLSPEETHHLARVLRHKPGDQILVIDGLGQEFQAKVLAIERTKEGEQARVEILKLVRKEFSPRIKITAFIPILKGDLTEFLVEKGTELGVFRFIPFFSRHTVVKPKKNLTQRLRAKAISALKQSGRLILPEVCAPADLKTLVEAIPANSLKVLAHPQGELSLENLLSLFKKEDLAEVYLISGPEGGFSEDEQALLFEAGFKPLCLSPYILRAETASLALMSLAQALSLSFDKDKLS